MISTGCESIVNVAGFRPSRFAVIVMVPGVIVERMATRLMPHSVSRIFVVGRVELRGVEAAAPDDRAADVEIHARLVGRAAFAFGVHDLEVNQRHVAAVGLQTFRAGVERELDGRGFARGLEFLLRDDFSALGGDGLERAGREGDVRERVDVAGVAQVSVRRR